LVAFVVALDVGRGTGCAACFAGAEEMAVAAGVADGISTGDALAVGSGLDGVGAIGVVTVGGGGTAAAALTGGAWRTAK